jgi:hypothetical protein
MAKKQNVWAKTNDYYNREVVKCDVWSKKFGRGMVYLMDREGFTYTQSMGANSEHSFTGSFYSSTKVKTVQDAMDALDVLVPLELSDSGYYRSTHKSYF